MKLVYAAYETWESAHLTSTPAIRFDKTGVCTYASFICEGTLPFTEENPPKGLIRFMSDDDMVLNELTVEDFLRYETHQNYEYVDDPNASLDAVVEAAASEDGTEVTEPTTPAQEQVPSTYSLILTNQPVPEPIPEPEPPTEEELLAMAKAGKDKDIENAMEQAIYNGIDVKTTYGTEHFTLNTEDQTLLLGIYGMVQQGIQQYPYHSFSSQTRSNNICTVYSDEDIKQIAIVAFGHITFHESYTNMLLQWLNRETDREVVATIVYGATLPSDLMSYLAMILTSAGIDPSVIPGYTVDSSTDSETETGAEKETPAEPVGDTTEETQNEPEADVSTDPEATPVNESGDGVTEN